MVKALPVPNFNVVLVEPEIPNNTGNIGRTCVGLNCRLHLVEPLGFEINDRQLKRAGLDYWPNLDLQIHAGLGELQKQISEPERMFFLSTKGERDLFDLEFRQGDYLLFGRETKGLSEDLLRTNWDRVFKIPMEGPIRSFNLANSVAMVLTEGLRQLRAAHRP